MCCHLVYRYTGVMVVSMHLSFVTPAYIVMDFGSDLQRPLDLDDASCTGVVSGTIVGKHEGWVVGERLGPQGIPSC